jgi:hypothetical protein
MTIGEQISIRMTPYVCPFEEGAEYLTIMRSREVTRYFVAHLEQGQWHDGIGTNLTEDGWELIAHTSELPLLK